MGTLNSGTGDFNSRLNLPIYTTGNYPTGVEGDMLYDTTAGSIFIFNGQNWVPPGFGRKPIATGGDSVLLPDASKPLVNIMKLPNHP